MSYIAGHMVSGRSAYYTLEIRILICGVSEHHAVGNDMASFSLCSHSESPCGSACLLLIMSYIAGHMVPGHTAYYTLEIRSCNMVCVSESHAAGNDVASFSVCSQSQSPCVST